MDQETKQDILTMIQSGRVTMNRVQTHFGAATTYAVYAPNDGARPLLTVHHCTLAPTDRTIFQIDVRDLPVLEKLSYQTSNRIFGQSKDVRDFFDIVAAAQKHAAVINVRAHDKQR